MPDPKKWAVACQKCHDSLEILYTTTEGDEGKVREHLGKLMDLHLELLANDGNSEHTSNPDETKDDTRKWPHRVKPYQP